jgi:hypothetical protein
MTFERSTVVAAFSSRAQAEQAVAELHRAGFRDDQLGLALRDDRAPSRAARPGEETAAGEGAVAGAVTGAALGGLAGAVAAGLIPGIGPIVAAGLLASSLTGAAAGAAAGGVLGALLGMGVPEEEARYYDAEFRSGRTIVTVQTDDRREEAIAILQRCGAADRGTARTAVEATSGPRTV